MSTVLSRNTYFLLSLSFVLMSSTLRAQSAADSAIDQARLLQKTPAAPVGPVDENGNALSTDGETSGDESFGAQVLLKDQERVRPFTVSAGATAYYTNNVALTRRGTQDDVFVVADAAGSWSHPLNPEVEISIGLQAATFRYAESSELDFDSLGGGVGLSWTPRRW
ncbi:MAG: hypothetical protein ACRD5Z_14955, partial [Bryobacteraceae bacterium]